MRDIVAGAEERVRGGGPAGEGFAFADKEQWGIAQLAMADIPLPSGGVGRCGALRLPVEELIADRVIFIHSGW